MYYYEKACDLKDATGCYNVGVQYYNGKAEKRDIAEAKQYFGKACDLGEQKGCDEYRKITAVEQKKIHL